MYITYLYGALFPGIQNLLHPKSTNSKPCTDLRCVPPQHKVELRKLLLQIRAVVFRKGGNLRRKGDLVFSNRVTQAVKPHVAQSRLTSSGALANFL